jgi:fluoroacetyl-CoA thioesterase
MQRLEQAIGRERDVEFRVDATHTADVYGNLGLEVLASPALIALVEQVAMSLTDELLEPGERTVGSEIHVEHLAPTPLTARLVVRARIESVEGRKVWFYVEATDDAGRIATGRHARFVIDEERFKLRVASHPSLAQAPPASDINSDPKGSVRA